MEQRLRAYHFQIMYLPGAHAGIQSEHTMVEMFIKYTHSLMVHPDIQSKTQTCEAMLYDWADEHKTIIVLNGGYQSSLRSLVGFLDSYENPYPWAFFEESKEALNGCLTNVGIIVPEKVYHFGNYGTEYKLSDGLAQMQLELSDWEVQLAKRISRCKLIT